MKVVTVTLGGQQYEIAPLPIGPSRQWRENLAEPFGQLVTTLREAPKTELDDFQSLGELVAALSDTVIGATDLIIEMLFAYSPILAADRERIEAEAYDEEAMVAFVEVLKLAYPFSALVKLIKGNGVGRTKPRTSKS